MIPLSLSTAEPEDFELDDHHFPTCPAQWEGPCDCDEEVKNIRADYAESLRECY